MADFKLLTPSSEALYWYEVASYIAPYATIGSFVLNAFSLASEAAQERRLAEISKKLDEIMHLIVQTKEALEQKMLDIVFKERTGEVLGIHEALQEFRNLRNQGMLDNILSDSAQTKRKIKTWIDAPDTPVALRAAYCGLYLSLLPLRIATFELFERPLAQINPLVKDELQDILDVAPASLACSDTVGRSRVGKVKETIILLDEMGPVYGTDFTVLVDADIEFLGAFLPRHKNLKETRDNAHARREALATQKGLDAAAPFQQASQAASQALLRLA